jgi:hypothetical protein
MPLEHLLLPVQGLVVGHFATITCANKLAPVVLFSIGCGGLVAVLTVQSQAYFRQTSWITFIEAGMYS